MADFRKLPCFFSEETEQQLSFLLAQTAKENKEGKITREEGNLQSPFHTFTKSWFYQVFFMRKRRWKEEGEEQRRGRTDVRGRWEGERGRRRGRDCKFEVVCWIAAKDKFDKRTDQSWVTWSSLSGRTSCPVRTGSSPCRWTVHQRAVRLQTWSENGHHHLGHRVWSRVEVFGFLLLSGGCGTGAQRSAGSCNNHLEAVTPTRWMRQLIL